MLIYYKMPKNRDKQQSNLYLFSINTCTIICVATTQITKQYRTNNYS